MLLPTICHVLIFLNILSPSAVIPPPNTPVLPPGNTNISYPSFLYPISVSAGDGGHAWVTHHPNELRGMLNDLMWLTESSRGVLFQWLVKKCMEVRQSGDSLSFNQGDVVS